MQKQTKIFVYTAAATGLACTTTKALVFRLIFPWGKSVHNAGGVDLVWGGWLGDGAGGTYSSVGLVPTTAGIIIPLNTVTKHVVLFYSFKTHFYFV